ncbi:DNA-directed RNA polymerase subunit delta [Lentibacillus saliphilus]|uniref:DNA-directed RNA polymerase subunit delta n=1 Tax=Lentibacillus saliphilus TaxID=2737028 RepID=UPI001C301400
MSLKTVGHEELKKYSMIELAEMILQEEGKAMDFKDVFAKIKAIKGFKEDVSNDRLAQFYTDLNVDGRFLTIGSNMWGLKRWYPVEQIDEIITTEPKKKKKTKKKKAAAKEVALIEEDEQDLDTVDDDIDELTRNLAKGDEDEDEDYVAPYDDDYTEDYEDEDFDEDFEDDVEEEEEEEEDN